MKKEIWDGKKRQRLGTKERPAVVSVQTEDRLKEVTAIFEHHGWEYKIDLNPDEPEAVGDLDMLLNPIKPVKADKKIGRNEPCPCGSGKKYKKCCGS